MVREGNELCYTRRLLGSRARAGRLATLTDRRNGRLRLDDRLGGIGEAIPIVDRSLPVTVASHSAARRSRSAQVLVVVRPFTINVIGWHFNSETTAKMYTRTLFVAVSSPSSLQIFRSRR